MTIGDDKSVSAQARGQYRRHGIISDDIFLLEITDNRTDPELKHMNKLGGTKLIL